MMDQMTFTPIAPSELISTIVEELKNELKKYLVQPSKEKQSDEEEYFNTKQACDFLKCSSVKLWRLRKEGHIPFEKCGRTILIKKNDLKLYLARTAKKGGQND